MALLISLMELLQRQTVPIILFLLILIPFLTHYISTTLFYRTVNNKTSGNIPPTVPYWIPGVYHALALASGPAAYFAKLLKEYDHYAPFVVKAGPLSLLVLRDPDHVKRVFQASKQLTPKAYQVRLLDKVMAVPKKALPIYKNIGAGLEESDQVDYAHLTVAQKHLTGSSVIPLAEVYLSILQRNLSNKMFQTKTWTQIEDLWSFFEIEVTRATMETIFGSALLKQYPEVVRDFWQFAANIEGFLWGLPQFMMTSPYSARDRLLENLKKWLQANHGGTGFGELGDDDPVWNETKGSKFIQERDQVFANLPSFNYQSRAAEVLGVMHQSISNTMPATFWCIVEILRNPALVKQLTAELAHYHDPKSGSYDIEPLANLPIIQSIRAEIARLRLATYAVRSNEGDRFNLDQSWAIPKGMSVLIFSHDLGLKTELWAKARPQTVIRPLEEFCADRFLIPEKPTSRKEGKKNYGEVTRGRFSMEGLEALHVTSGGGDHCCPEHFLVEAIQAVTLAVLLTEFEVQLCDPEATERALPPLREAAYGTIKPLDKVAIRLRKRITAEKSA